MLIIAYLFSLFALWFLLFNPDVFDRIQFGELWLKQVLYVVFVVGCWFRIAFGETPREFS